MIYDNIEFFNVEELEEKKGVQGKIIKRFDQNTIDGLDDDDGTMGPFAALYSNECEMRFVTSRKNIKLYLSALDINGFINVYNGDYYVDTYEIIQGKINCINLELNDRLSQTEERAKKIRFNKNVWRIVFLKRFTAIYHGINVGNCKIRPPKKEEVLEKTFLVYGSSISFGAKTGKATDQSHMQILARKLNYQALNKSMPGSCFCENAITDCITKIDNVDFYIYEIGGNMRNRYTVEQFKQRFEYLMDQTLKSSKGKLIFVIDVYWTLENIPFEDKQFVAKVVKGYNSVMVEYIKKRNNNNIILINSKKIITDYSLMCADMIHPSLYGNIIMAENLYKEISKYVLK